MKQLSSWLADRLERSLSQYQLQCLSFMIKARCFSWRVFKEMYLQKLYTDWELHGIDEEKLNCKPYQAICKRVQLEETNAALVNCELKCIHICSFILTLVHKRTGSTR